MLPWTHLDTANVPGGGALHLKQRGNEFAIFAGNTPLMNSRMSGSEVALADIASERLKSRKNARILIGGYGMGFTLRAALAGLPKDAQIVIAELVPQVIAWACGPMAELTAQSLTDKRVTIHEADVGEVIIAARTDFDAILLDVDNGPDELSAAGNASLYDARGLREAHRALRPGGLLAVWSAAPNKDFTRRMGNAGFETEEVIARAHKGKGARHTIWVGTKVAG